MVAEGVGCAAEVTTIHTMALVGGGGRRATAHESRSTTIRQSLFGAPAGRAKDQCPRLRCCSHWQQYHSDGGANTMKTNATHSASSHVAAHYMELMQRLARSLPLNYARTAVSR